MQTPDIKGRSHAVIYESLRFTVTLAAQTVGNEEYLSRVLIYAKQHILIQSPIQPLPHTVVYTAVEWELTA